MASTGTIAMALAMQLPIVAARIAITEMWPMSSACNGPASYKFVHDLDTCINVAAPTSRSTQLATTAKDELVVRGFDDPTKCSNDTNTDFALVESWSLLDECNSGRYKGPDGVERPFRYMTRVYTDASADMTTPNQLEGVEVNMYAAPGTNTWCQPSMSTVTTLQKRYGECFAAGDSGMYYRVNRLVDPTGGDADFLVQAYTDDKCEVQRYMWALYGGVCWGSAESGYTFTLKSYTLPSTSSVALTTSAATMAATVATSTTTVQPTPTDVTATSEPATGESSSDNTAVIIGAAVGGAAALVLIAAGAIYAARRRRSNLKGADDAFAYGNVMNSGVYESGTDSQTNPLYRVTD